MEGTVKLQLRKILCYLPPGVVPVTCLIGVTTGADFSLPHG